MINGKQKWTMCEQKNIIYTHTHTHAHTHTHTRWKNDYTVLQYDKHVKLQWVDVIKLWLRIWTNAYGKEVGMSVKAGLTAEDVLGKDVWGMISYVRASFSKAWMGNAAESVTLWASRQNGLLMPWLIVAYALCTTLADHPDTQLIVQITRLCPRCKAKVKVVAPWQTAYYVLMLEPLCSDVKATMFWC